MGLGLVFALAAGAFSLDLEAPPGCGDASQILSEVRSLAPNLDQQLWSAAAVIQGPPWRATLTVDRAPRQLEASSCGALVRAITLILAVTSDALGAPAPTPRPPVAQPPFEARSPVTAPPPAATPTPTATSLPLPPLSQSGFGLRALVAVDRGPVPGLGVDLELEAQHPLGPLRVGLGVSVLLPVEGSLRTEPAAGGTVARYAGVLRGCGEQSWAPFRGSICGVAEAGTLRAEGYGVRTTRAAWAPWIGLGTELEAALRLDPDWALVLPVRLEFALVRPVFRLDPVGELQPDFVNVRVGLGVERQFP